MTNSSSSLPGTGEPVPQVDVFRHPLRLSLAALALGLAVEILFYARPVGISFPIWAALVCLVGVGMAWAESRRPATGSLWLVVPIVGFAALAFVRLEPLTLFLNIVVVLALLAFWVRTFRTGRLLAFGWVDYLVAMAWVPLEALLRPWQVLSAANRQALGDRGANSRLVAILRGMLLALPILVVFAALLTAADLIFADYLRRALEWLDLERLADLARRTVVVLVCAIFFLGALVAALRDPGDRKLIGEHKPLLAPFLGFTELVVVLAAVDLLFALFVFIQIRYLFGGEAEHHRLRVHLLGVCPARVRGTGGGRLPDAGAHPWPGRLHAPGIARAARLVPRPECLDGGAGGCDPDLGLSATAAVRGGLSDSPACEPIPTPRSCGWVCPSCCSC